MTLKDKRVFVVEDNAGNLAITSIILKQQGAIVLSERWGNNVPQKLVAHLPIDLILLDLMLPDGVTGYDVFDQLQLVPQLKTIPAVLITAADPDEEMEKARRKGFSGFITKPIRSNTFAQYISNILNGTPVWMAE